MDIRDRPIRKPHETTPAELNMAKAMGEVAHDLMAGQLTAVGICAKSQGGENICLFFDPDLEGLELSGPLEKLRSMYELNQSFRKQTTAPSQNRSYKEH